MSIRVNTPEKRIFYISRNDGTDTRISKECKSLSANGYELLFLGWDRNPGADKSDPMPGIRKKIYAAKSHTKSITAVTLLQYYFFIAAELIRGRPQVVHAVNEDLAFMVLPFKYLLGFRLVCDIFDSLSLRYANRHFPLGWLVNIVCRISWICSDALLMTDAKRAGRLDRFRHKIKVVANYPEDPGYGYLKDIKVRTGNISLYVGGTLYKERGLDLITQLLKMNEDLKIVCAGWIYDEEAKRFINHPQVEYLGVLTPQESLFKAATCDAVVALYDPSNVNNIWASPNKVYDAMCIGRPVIINRETHIAAWVQAEGVGYVLEYHDIVEFNSILALLRSRKSKSQSDAAYLRRVFERGYSWRQAEKELISAYAQIF